MNREQMIAWLTLGGWEPGIYTTDRDKGANNYFVRHPDYPGGYCLDIERPIRDFKSTKGFHITHSTGNWFTPFDKPGDWSPFTDNHLDELVGYITQCK